MAGTPDPQPELRHGWKATIFALVFALAVLGGFGAATAVSAPEDHGESHAEEKSGENHGEDDAGHEADSDDHAE